LLSYTRFTDDHECV